MGSDSKIYFVKVAIICLAVDEPLNLSVSMFLSLFVCVVVCLNFYLSSLKYCMQLCLVGC